MGTTIHKEITECVNIDVDIDVNDVICWFNSATYEEKMKVIGEDDNISIKTSVEDSIKWDIINKIINKIPLNRLMKLEKEFS